MPKLFCSFSKTWKYFNFPVKILKIKTNSCVDTQSKREFCKFLTQRHLCFSFIFFLGLFWKEFIKIIGGALSSNKQRPVWFWKNRETTAWKDRIFIKYFIFFICVKFNRLNDILWRVKYLPHDEFWLDTKKWQFWSEFCFSRGKRKITNSWIPLSF